MGEIERFFGIRITRDEEVQRISLYQDSYIDKLTSRYDINSITLFLVRASKNVSLGLHKFKTAILLFLLKKMFLKAFLLLSSLTAMFTTQIDKGTLLPIVFLEIYCKKFAVLIFTGHCFTSSAIHGTVLDTLQFEAEQKPLLPPKIASLMLKWK